MTTTRLRVESTASAGCSLVEGERECHCARDAPYLTDEEIRLRATGMSRWLQRADVDGRASARLGLDHLLAHARERRSASLVSDLLEIGIMTRIIGLDRVDEEDVLSLLAGFTELAELDGNGRGLGEAATLRAHSAIVFGRADQALADAAAALAILTDITRPGPGENDAEWARRMSRALNGLVVMLLKLGAHEVADGVSLRAIVVADSSGSIMDRLVHQLNRVRLQVAWALRLERGGRDAAAAARFVGAAQTARVAAMLWAPAFGRTDPGGPTAANECSIIGATYALRRPGPEYLPTLVRLTGFARFPDDRIVLAIATARCLMADGRPDAAFAALEPLCAEMADHDSGAGLTLALHRELAQVDAVLRATAERTGPGAGSASAVEGRRSGSGPPADGKHDTASSRVRSDDALRSYAAALESELWMLREARLAALSSHYEHHRLTREHGAAAALALQDPLTGLPNRRALDRGLAEATSGTAGQPCAVALLDLDRFKDVNDALSHATGDLVLREVAECLRTALRSHDMVARYGGDEFVVIMPATPLHEARAALTRVTEAVAALPIETAAGVTVSAGVVQVPPGTDQATVLAAADAAMYRAKRAGGNVVIGGTTSSHEPAAIPIQTVAPHAVPARPAPPHTPTGAGRVG